MVKRIHPALLLLGAGIVLQPAPSQALIVWEGRVVQSWPDQVRPKVQFPPGVAAAEWPIGTYPSPKGEVWGLTIVVDFSDTAPEFSIEDIDAWLNESGYSAGGLNGSIRDYFWDNSLGQVDFQNEIVGIVRAAQPKAYYEAGNGYERAGELVAELLEAIDDEVDFSQFDNDGDGRTEAISIVYAGPAETFAQGLWPHSGGLRETRDGVQLVRYQMSQMGNSLGLYTFAHEVGHMLFGWPDLYGFGNYCIMGNSSSMQNPVGINDFYRADQGWIPVIDIAETDNVRYRAVPDAGGYRYVNPDRPDEAFFWSNVQATNRWSTLNGSGLVFLHFDYAIRTNDPPNPLSLAVVQADGLQELDQTTWPEPGSDPNDFYHAGTNTELSADTVPASNWNDGSPSGLRVYEISENGDEMTFSVGHGTPDPGIAGAGGVGGVGGAPAAGGSGGMAEVGGSSALGGAGGTVGTEGTTTGGGQGGGLGVGGAVTGIGGAASVDSGATGTTGDMLVSTTSAGGSSSPSLGGSGSLQAPEPSSDEASGCACRVHPTPQRGTLWLGWLGFGLLLMRRRRFG